MNQDDAEQVGTPMPRASSDDVAAALLNVDHPNAVHILAAEVRALRDEYKLACSLLKTATIAAATHLAAIERVKALLPDWLAQDEECATHGCADEIAAVLQGYQ